MSRLNFDIDDTTLLKTYKLSTSRPNKWEETEDELDENLLISPTGTGATSSQDPLGLGAEVDVRRMDMETKTAVLLTSKAFNPKAFLSVIHPNATYQDLHAGVSHLRSALDSRSEAIRVLVEQNFDRFVAVKNATDALHADMREGLLAPQAEFGSVPLRDYLKSAAQKADVVFLPVLENSLKAQKLRTTLSVFERSRFFFNLPGSLVESLEAGRYEAAMRDYKKGKFLLARPGQIIPIGSTKDGQGSLSAEQQQKRILDKVWSTVERVMGEMRSDLLAKLQDPHRSVDEQEKTLDILMELNPQDEPVWAYFDAQHQAMMDQMRDTYNTSLNLVKSAHEKAPADTSSPEALTSAIAGQLKQCVAALEPKSSEHAIAHAGGHGVWQAVLNLVKNISEVMLSTLPNFWKISRAVLDGKYRSPKSSSHSSRRSPSQCKTMALDIVKLYISLLSEFFLFSDSHVMSPPGSLGHTTPPLLPRETNSLTTSHHLMKILGEIQESVNEINAMEISNEASSSLKNLLESARWKFEDILIHTWTRDANLFYYLETWTGSITDPYTTVYLSQMRLFQKQITTSAFKVAGGVDLAPSSMISSRIVKQNQLGQEFVSKITKAFLDSLYAFLDGLVHLASDESPDPDSVKKPATDATTMTSTNPLALLDFHSPDTRLLLVLSNLGHLQRVLIPNMMSELESAFSLNLESDKRTLMTVVNELDKTLFGTFVKPKSAALIGIVRSGILDPAMDWYETPQPKEIRPYIYELLM
ncbi:Exocyst complex component SEC5, partial [Abortiporus biennis]